MNSNKREKRLNNPIIIKYIIFICTNQHKDIKVEGKKDKMKKGTQGERKRKEEKDSRKGDGQKESTEQFALISKL